MFACLLLLVTGDIGSQQSALYRLGDIPLDSATYQRYLKVLPPVATLPASYDARNDGIVTPAKDQGNCGGCWAFASAGAMESHMLKKFAFGPVDMAEQQLISCNSSMVGCCGGSSTAPRYWETAGPVYEGCMPFAESGTSCPTQSTKLCSNSTKCPQLGYRVIDWYTVSSSQFKTSLYNDGPSYWRFDVYGDFFTYWNSGSAGSVYVNTGSTFQGGHAVLLIGWDDAKNAYLCKNSWGSTGGPNDDGTFWIAYTGHTNNLNFGMSNFDLARTGLAITMSQPSYVNGNIVTASEFRLQNVGSQIQCELKSWLAVPTLPPISILNLGSDGSFLLPAGFNQDFGPITLFQVGSVFPRGSYQFNSRVVDLATGATLSEDINAFAIQ